MLIGNSIQSAGRWLLHSGIQAPSGGFARYYDAAAGRYKPVSTEITGYAASALIYLFEITGNEEYLERARQTARFLVRAWDRQLRTFPYEYPSPSAESEHLAYFFDCGIIVRGLLAVWGATGDEQFLDIARAAACSMIQDFRASDDYHPVLLLPAKQPLPRSGQWSRGSGCYQLKAATAWRDLAEITGEGAFGDAYLEMLARALETHATFLPGTSCREDVMDRLHAYAYFLEGLLPVAERPECRKAYVEGIHAIDSLAKEIEPAFVRVDVYAQLLRARLYSAMDSGARDCGRYMADELLAFQAVNHDPRISGGFYFGRRAGSISPQVNPVSTVFALQALAMWRQQETEVKPPCLRMLI